MTVKKQKSIFKLFKSTICRMFSFPLSLSFLLQSIDDREHRHKNEINVQKKAVHFTTVLKQILPWRWAHQVRPQIFRAFENRASVTIPFYVYDGKNAIKLFRMCHAVVVYVVLGNFVCYWFIRWMATRNKVALSFPLKPNQTIDWLKYYLLFVLLFEYYIRAALTHSWRVIRYFV